MSLKCKHNHRLGKHTNVCPHKKAPKKQFGKEDSSTVTIFSNLCIQAGIVITTERTDGAIYRAACCCDFTMKNNKSYQSHNPKQTQRTFNDQKWEISENTFISGHKLLQISLSFVNIPYNFDSSCNSKVWLARSFIPCSITRKLT